MRGTNVEINENKHNKSPGIRKVLVDQSYDTARSMTDNDKVIFRDILQKTGFYNRKTTKGRLSGCGSSTKNDLDKDVKKF